jgi:tetratricopeptide (TPR) repeat protein
MLSPFVIYKIKISNNFNRLFSILVLIQIIIIVTITLSRAVIFASLISIVTYIIISFNNDTKLGWKNSVIVLFSMIIIIASSIHLFRRSDFLNEQVYKTVELNSSGRGELNNSTLRLVKDNIFFGVGPSNWKIEIWNYDLYKKGVDKDSPYVNSSYFFASNPHNDYLWVASEIGVLGSFVYMLFLFLLLNELLKLFKRNEILYKLLFSTLIGFIFISYFSFPLIQTVQPYLIMVIVAIVISSNRIKVKSLNHNYINLFLVSVLIVFSLNLFSKYMYSRSIEFQNENNLDKMIANMDYALMINDVDISSTPLKWYTGISKYKQGKIKEALIDFLAAKEVNPFHVHNLNNIGTCYHNLGDIETSKRFYSLSLEYVNCFYESRKNLAVLYNNDGLYKEALEVLLLSKVDSSYEVRLECSPEYDYHLQKILFNFLDSHNPLFSNSNQCEIEKQKYLQSPGVYRNYLKVYMIEDNSLEEYVKKLSIE